MSLPTPPSTSHRDKESRSARFSSGPRVVWSEENQYHTVSASPSHRLSVESSAKKAPPTKSILKQTAFVLPLEGDDQRETTPEPIDPLVNLHYLEGPVLRIIAIDASLRQLIEAYSILASRLRSCLAGSTEIDSSWPLFQPLRQHCDAFVDALVRDLGRVFVDPATVATDETPSREEGEEEEEDWENEKEERIVALPSPKDSPKKKKKKGMSEEQVKFARDLCTVCHAAIKLLNAIFSLPALCQLFTDDQLKFLLTHALAIPLANELPTPNARKTCALSIWLLQTQRLPNEILMPAKDRIAYALRRAIEGELGKEGKKGSMNDGMKAIHELSMGYPEIFVPAFTEVLPSMLSSLLAPTLVLRSQACHALGGFAFAAASLPSSEVHTRISNIVVTHLTPAPSPPLSSGPASPSKDSALIRTLRTTLGATDPRHVAQGPVWAWSVLANLVVLLGPGLFADERITRSISALFTLGIRHQKSSVRALGCLAWRCLIWSYFHAPLVKLVHEEDGPEEEEGQDESQEMDLSQGSEDRTRRMEQNLKFIQSIVDMGTGVTMIGALLSGQPAEEHHLQRALRILRAMSKKGGHLCKDALDTTVRLVSLEEETEWNAQKLLAPGLFCAMPGLLTAEYPLLAQTVKPLFEQCTQVEDLRPLTKSELATDWVFDGLLEVWREGLSALRLSWGCDIPSEILNVWHGLLKAPLTVLQDENDEEGIVEFAGHAVTILIELLRDRELDLSLEEETCGHISTTPVKIGHQVIQVPPHSRWNLGLKIYLIRELWNGMKAIFPESTLNTPAEKLLKFVVGQEDILLDDIDDMDEVRYQWSSLCAEIIYTCDNHEVVKFWCERQSLRSKKRNCSWIPEVRRAVWHTFVEKWRENPTAWEVAVLLLGVPFMDANAWEMSNEDVDAWDELLRITMDKALDYGIDSVSVIDQVASTVSSNNTPTFSSTRVVDLLLSHLEINEARQTPTDVLEFTNDTLVSTYPPEPRNKVTSLWLLRSLTRVIDACPVELSMSMFELLQEGLSLWISDDYEVFTAEEYAMDILPIYQTVLLGIQQSVPPSADTVEALAPLLDSAFCGRKDKPEAARQAFQEFWQDAYVDVPEPYIGWSFKIRHCIRVLSSESDEQLGGADANAVDDTTYDADMSVYGDANDSNDALFDEGEEDDEDAVSALLSTLSPAISLLTPTLTSSSSKRSDSTTTPPSTPKIATQDLPATPPRPQKSSGHAQISSIVLVSPVRAPTTPRRSTGSTPRRSLTSSARRRSLDNKENVSPLPVFATVAERIAHMSPGQSLSSLGKRRMVEDASDEKAAKRSKLDLSPEDKLTGVLSTASNFEPDREVRVSVFFQDVTPRAPGRTLPKTPYPKRSPSDDEDSDACETSSGESSSAAQASTSALRPRKRKSVFLDAVEVPTLREVRRLQRSASLLSVPSRRVESSDDESDGGESTTPTSSRPRRPLRRTRSATKLLGENAGFEKLVDTPRKRRKSRVSELRAESLSSPSLSSSPFRGLQDVPIAGSDDSIMLATPSKSLPSQLSSDDDPHTGQVTPLGVVSPALRRVRTGDADVSSSDDSNMSASPSREHVKRRIARMPSSKKFLNPSPLKFRSLLNSGSPSTSFKSDE